MSRSLLVQQDSGAGGPRLPDLELQDVELCEATVQESTEATLEEGTEGGQGDVRTGPVSIILCICTWMLSVPQIP